MWKPNEECLDVLLTMGFTRNTAERVLSYFNNYNFLNVICIFQALLNTGNTSVEKATAWIVDNPQTTSLDIPITEDEIQKAEGKCTTVIVCSSE